LSAEALADGKGRPAEPRAPAAPAPRPAAPVWPPTLEGRLFTEGYAFDFFQAVRLLERLAPDRRPVGGDGPPDAEVARFRVLPSVSFPASAVYDIERPEGALPPAVTVAFLGLTGPSGVLPGHYTELLIRLQRGERGPEQEALRSWLDLFNHRLLSLFYRAWEKYRFYIPYERGEYARAEPDPFTRSLFSLLGLGQPSLRNRLRVSCRREEDGEPREEVLARVNDLALLYYGGLLAHRPRCAVSLEAFLHDYFQLPVRVQQFQGQWLLLDTSNQSRLGAEGGNCRLGRDAVAGERVWDVQGKVRIRLGPLGYGAFTEFTPDRAPVARRKALFLLIHLVRLYLGPELLFDVQLVLKADEVPSCRLEAGDGIGPRLGWNTWACSRPPARDADDPVFEGEEVVDLGPG
jgi:type VI secretion system protein ImpH